VDLAEEFEYLLIAGAGGLQDRRDAGAELDLIAGVNLKAAVDALTVYEGAVTAAFILNEIDTVFIAEPGMVARDAGVLQDNILFRLATDGYRELIKRNRPFLETVADEEYYSGCKLGGGLCRNSMD
jgi:hypothetical protein